MYKPKICVTLTGKDAKEMVALSKKVPDCKYFEVRADFLDDIKELRKVLNYFAWRDEKVLVTIRNDYNEGAVEGKKLMSNAEKIKWLRYAAARGFDIDVEYKWALKEKVLDLVKDLDSDIDITLSLHNTKKTPGLIELADLYKDMYRYARSNKAVTILKIATKSSTQKDYNKMTKLSTLAQDLGGYEYVLLVQGNAKWRKDCNIIHGSEKTFGAVDEEHKVPNSGQLTFDELKEYYENMLIKASSC